MEKTEKSLLNEIAHLTNLLESSKKQSDSHYRPCWTTKVQKFSRNPPYSCYPPKTKTFKPQMRTINHHCYSLRRTNPPPVVPKPTPEVTLKKISPVRPTQSASSSKNDPKITESSSSPLQVQPQQQSQQPKDCPKRYYAIEPSASPVQAIVQRRLPSDSSEKINSKCVNDDAHDSAATTTCGVAPDVFAAAKVGFGSDCGSGGQGLSDDECKNEGKVMDQGYLLRRTRLMTQLSKLTSHKERLRGTSNNGSLSLPAYLPC